MYSKAPASTTATPSAAHSQAPFFAPAVQAKLTVNEPGDAYEQEADRVADQVMRMKEGDAPIVQRMPLTPAGSLMRKCTECEKDEKEQVQRKETGGSDTSGKAAPSIVSGVLSSGGGRPMDGGTRQFMESRFGQDFGQVRIHVGGQAAESASAIQARAYTSGKDIVFGSGEYQPESEGGRRLLAHELVHVGQQNKPSGLVSRHTAPPCRRTQSETAARAIIHSNPRRYPSSVVMDVRCLASGENLTVIAQSVFRQNRVDNVGQLADELVLLNSHLPATLQPGHAIITISNWTHPNIGTLPAITAGPLPVQFDEIVATIFGEQSRPGRQEDEQRKYIWLSMKKRLFSSSFPNTLSQVILQGHYDAYGGRDYTSALTALTQFRARPSAGLTPILTSIIAMIRANYGTGLPGNAGALYFHWRAGTSIDQCAIAARANRGRRSTPTDQQIENDCVSQKAIRSQFIHRAALPLHVIRGSAGTPEGTMYIYP